MALHDIGGICFFIDPLSAHPHMADVLSLVRMSNVNNVMLATNPTTAQAFVKVLQAGLNATAEQSEQLLPSFFHTLKCHSLDKEVMQNRKAAQAEVRNSSHHAKHAVRMDSSLAQFPDVSSKPFPEVESNRTTKKAVPKKEQAVAPVAAAHASTADRNQEHQHQDEHWSSGGGPPTVIHNHMHAGSGASDVGNANFILTVGMAVAMGLLLGSHR
jgi:methylglyoxal synthase